MNGPSRRSVLAARRRFAAPFGLGLAILAAIHVAPLRSFPFDAPYNGLRLGCTVAYFATVVMMLRQLTGPRARYAALLYEWRFADCPPPMERAWGQYLYSVDATVGFVARAAIVFVLSNAAGVLAAWYPSLTALHPVYNAAWWISGAGLLLLPFTAEFLISEPFHRWRMLDEMVKLHRSFKPRDLADLHRDESAVADVAAAEARRRGPGIVAGGAFWAWEALTKNLIVFGQVGSGKTLCVLNTLLDELLASPPDGGLPAGALILDPKGDFDGKLQALCRRYGREADLVTIDPKRPGRGIRWNPFDSDDDEFELASRFVAAMETLGMKSNDTSVWVDSARKFFVHAIRLIRLTSPPGEPPSFREIGRLAASRTAVAERAQRLDPRDPSGLSCLSYFAEEWAELASETRSSIQMHISNMTLPFEFEPYASVFSGRSDLRIDAMIDEGKIVYLALPVADGDAMARTIGTLLKLEYFRGVRRRVGKRRPTFFLCDEFQRFFTTARGKGDSDEFEVTRQSNHANLIATHNLSSLVKNADAQNRAPVDNLLGNCAVKLFLRNSDPETNRYASGLFGEEPTSMPGSSAGAGRVGARFLGFQGFGRQVNESLQYDARVRPERCTTLAIPSREGGRDHCEAIVHDGSRAEVDRRPSVQRWRARPIGDGPAPERPALPHGRRATPLLLELDDPCSS
ncbi:MAG: hypothetical protein BGO49_10930 [Planctomycetales bacterium 71-10]|nr:MAG: hypothetical protein BGO49_10930 [Planctomycetales bacterium 71-10]